MNVPREHNHCAGVVGVAVQNDMRALSNAVLSRGTKQRLVSTQLSRNLNALRARGGLATGSVLLFEAHPQEEPQYYYTMHGKYIS